MALPPPPPPPTAVPIPVTATAHPPTYYYIPQPYPTTHIPNHSHHLPLEQTRHAISQALSHFSHEVTHPWDPHYPMYTPHADIREFPKFYHLQVELPGARSGQDLTLKWTDARTLYLSATTVQSLGLANDNDLDEEEPLQQPETKSKDAPVPDTAATAAPASPPANATPPPEPQPPKPFLAERRVGKYARAFTFPIAIDQTKTTARLGHGVLEIRVVKAKDEDGDGYKHKHVKVEWHDLGGWASGM